MLRSHTVKPESPSSRKIAQVKQGISVHGHLQALLGDSTAGGGHVASGAHTVGESATVKSWWELLCEEYPDVFGDPKTPPDCPITHQTNVELGSKPPSLRLYHMSLAELAKVCRKLDEYLEKGSIHSSMSLYGAPILFVCKKNLTLRKCIDYRVLN